MSFRYDAAVVGAGILGLAHAYHLAKRGLKVAVFERSAKAQGASVRNFGMLWPIGQPPGEMHSLALRSVEIWREILMESGIWHEPKGSLHLAYQEDEEQTLREFVAEAPNLGYTVEMFSGRQVIEQVSGVNPKGLRCGMFSPTEICIDPREAVSALPAYLHEKLGVDFYFNTLVTGYEGTSVCGSGNEWQSDRLYVCSGDDFQTLYPEAFAESGIIRCKLQMMRSAPQQSSTRVGPMLAAGLTLRHYKSFQFCPTLPALKERFAREMPEYDRYGIHVMASQNGLGEIVIGDSHEYGDNIEIFDKEEIDSLVLNYLQTFLVIPDLKIASRWHGIYGKHPEMAYFTSHSAPGVTIVTGVGGAGMTLSFGLAEKMIADTLN